MPEAQNTMIQNLSAAFTAAGVDVKGLLAKIGDLGALTTTQKASLVGALNELKTGIDAAVKIDDAKTQAGTTWSSTKINSAINAAISALVSGAPEALDTIKEVADAINTNKDAITALQQLAATAKTVAEKANGDLTTFKTNIGDTTVDFAAVYTAARDAE